MHPQKKSDDPHDNKQCGEHEGGHMDGSKYRVQTVVFVPVSRQDSVLFLQPQRQPCAGKRGNNPQDHKIKPGPYEKNQKPKII